MPGRKNNVPMGSIFKTNSRSVNFVVRVPVGIFRKKVWATIVAATMGRLM
jgi:hypothetical protein